jgi:hypothetical protein
LLRLIVAAYSAIFLLALISTSPLIGLFYATSYVALSEPFDLHGADASVRSMPCVGHGDFLLEFLNDDAPTNIRMYHCPQLLETLLSLQAICDENCHLFRGFAAIHCSDLDNAYVRFHRNWLSWR